MTKNLGNSQEFSKVLIFVIKILKNQKKMES